ncbi:MAG: histidine phosphatase family protein [Granulosicoccus sp.]
MLRLYLVRHGHTIWNDTGGVAGRTDIDLSKYGQEAVGALAQTLTAQVLLDSWYCSPLLRARHTSQLLSTGARIPAQRVTQLPDVVIDDRLVELDFGDWEGMTWQDVHRHYQQEMDLWGKDWVNRSPPGGESFAQQAVRCGDFLRELLSTSKKDRATMLVLHGGSIRALVCQCLGWSLSRAMDFSIDPATVTVVDLNRENNRWVVRKINATGF